MTNDERQRLCEHLRRTSDLSMEAAAEIERLAAENERLRKQQPGPNYVPIGGAGNGA